MKVRLTHFFVCLFLLPSYFVGATVFTSVADGNWETATTWDVGGGQIPGEFDDVIIKHDVFIDLSSNTTIQNLTITNDLDLFARLDVYGTESLIITGNLIAIAEDFNEDVNFISREYATVIVQGNTTFTRSADNDQKKTLLLNLGEQSKTYLSGDFTYNYLNSSGGEDFLDIMTSGYALLDVTGKTKLINSGGEDLDFRLAGYSQVVLRDSLFLSLSSTGNETVITTEEQSHFQVFGSATLLNTAGGSSKHVMLKSGDDGGKMTITGDLKMETQGVGSVVKFKAEGTDAELNLQGDLIMNAAGQEEVLVQLKDSGKFYFGGNLVRQTDFGALEMTTYASLIFNGTGPQTIPKSKLSGSGLDSLYFGKISFENTSSQPISLSDNLIVQDSLILTTGNIQTSPTAKIILEDNATIVGGSNSSYIVGPIQKLGRTNGVEMTFPTGTSTVYAPIKISPITDPLSDLTVQYSEPPPFGNDNLETGITSVSTKGYWNVEKNASTGDLDITLNWEDSSAKGITDLNSLIVVGWDGTMWRNYGQESSGTVGNGGFVTSLNSEPPPFGIETFTIGSTSTDNALPVELKRFNAIPQTDRVHLEWHTGSEINTSHFVVERSKNGNYFEEINSVRSEGSENSETKYTMKDLSPNNGSNYYRLKMVDNDGSYEYSKLEVVKFVKNAPVLIYPNPVKKMLHIKATDWQDEEVTLEIFDRNGSQVYGNTISFENGNFQITTDDINVSSWGTYIVRITGKTDSQVLKFVKTE